VEVRLGGGLFPGLERTVRDLQIQQTEVNRLLAQTEHLRHEVARASRLGGKQVQGPC